jgi:ATP-dependent Lon protease
MLDKISGLLIFQQKFRLLLKIKNNMNTEIDTIYDLLYSLMKRIKENFTNDIIPQHKYNTQLNKLDDIVNNFKELNRPFTIRYIKKIKIKKIRDTIDHIYSFLKITSKDCGTLTIYDILKINYKKSYKYMIIDSSYNNKKNLINFFNKVFVPTSYKIYDNLSKKNASEKEVTLYNPKITEEVLVYDLYNINNIKEPICKPLKKAITSIHEHINGTRLYLPINYKKNNVLVKNVIALNGYFIEDPLNLSRIGGTIEEKTNQINKLLNNDNININSNFKKGYVDQLSLRDFLTYSNAEIVDKCVTAYTEVNKYKEKTISSLVKEFLSAPIESQRNILTLFLLMKDDIETQYLAYLMYDMISNESYLLKPQPLAEQVYNSLHWSVQKLFKIAIKRVGSYTKKLLTFNEEDIPYEKRICLLKAPDYVKSKAMDKYKEVHKSNDNSSKCQQYLDGLLKIPFGVYKKEKIIEFLDEYKVKVYQFINNVLDLLSTLNSFNIINKDDINNLNNLCLKFNKVNLTSKEIDLFIEQFSKLNNKILNLFYGVDDNYVDELLENYKKTHKIDNIRNLIKSINLDLKIHKTDDVISIKGKKQELINNINNLLINIKDIKLKKKYIYYIQNSERNLDELDEINDAELHKNHNKINEEFINMSTLWTNYKNNSKGYLNDVEKTLDNAVYGQKEAKNEIKRIIAQWINGEMKGYCFGFEGPPGTGKTSIAKKGIAQCLVDDDGKSRPFAFIALGGSSNGSTLEGHSYTYVGSTWGKIVDIVMETECLNPIIFIDELDKISKTENGKEIIGILTHLTDSSQNDEFCDKYFSGIKFDLSKALIIFSYNDYNLLDPILADRIHRVKFRHLSKTDKKHIITHYIMPELCDTVGFNSSCVNFNENVIEYIITNYTFEAGIRKLKEKVFEIVREINLRYLMNSNKSQYPIDINLDMVKEIFSNKPKMLLKKIAKAPHIGLVNGLYATSAGIGGLTIIETFKTPSDSKLSLILTGQQGDVMQESVKCAKTIAWNILPNDIKTKINKEWTEHSPYGIHVHCPEAATPKDGPSAGGAITLAIVSLLSNIPVSNTVALTGEIDLNGSIHSIGGLDFKIDGGKLAGVKTILCPKQNEQDLEIIKKEKHEILENIEIKTVDNIWDILEFCLVENNIKFNRYC